MPFLKVLRNMPCQQVPSICQLNWFDLIWFANLIWLMWFEKECWTATIVISHRRVPTINLQQLFQMFKTDVQEKSRPSKQKRWWKKEEEKRF